MAKDLFRRDETTGLVDLTTGEFKGLKSRRIRVHVEEFFCMYLEACIFRCRYCTSSYVSY
jgi:hypothetical protein